MGELSSPPEKLSLGNYPIHPPPVLRLWLRATRVDSPWKAFTFGVSNAAATFQFKNLARQRERGRILKDVRYPKLENIPNLHSDDRERKIIENIVF